MTALAVVGFIAASGLSCGILPVLTVAFAAFAVATGLVRQCGGSIKKSM